MDVKESCIDVLKLLKNHTSVRKYKQENIPMETLKNLLISAQHAASSNFVQSYSVILVTDEVKKREIGILSNNQPQINSAPILLLFCADMKRLEHAAGKKQAEIQQQTAENFIVSVIDTALFAQNFVIAAESHGYGICFIGGVRNKPAEISSIVGLPDKTFPMFGMTVGIPDEEQMVKPRLPLEAVLHENTYDETKYKAIINQYDQTISDYYKKRLTNNKDNDWSDTMSAFLSERRREHMKSFLADKGFYFE
jgi:FMN reductase (NADPH)